MTTSFDPIQITAEFAGHFGLESARLDPDTPLLSSGVLGYLEMAETLDWIESRMGIRLDARDVRMEWIGTTRSMCELAARKVVSTVIEVKPAATAVPEAPVTVR